MANINALVPPAELGKDVSVQVSADQPITVARRLDRAGHDGSVSTGVTVLNHYNYFAEGYTAGGFKESLALFNPANSDASVELDLMPSTGGDPIVQTFSIGPMRRYTVNVNDLAKNQSVGAAVISGVELAAERTTTFGSNANGTSTVAGVATPQPTWYFAEGSTSNGFSEFITLLNPSSTASNVVSRFYDARGAQIGIKSQILQAGTRATIDVGKLVHASSVGAVVTSSQPILAERSMYRGGLQSADVTGSGSFGRTDLTSEYDFPAGDTGSGQSEFLLLLNPSGVPITALLTFYTQTGQQIPYTVTVPSRARVTVNVARDVPALPPGSHGVTVRSAGGEPFVAEQSLYGAGFTTASSSIGVAVSPTPTPVP